MPRHNDIDVWEQEMYKKKKIEIEDVDTTTLTGDVIELTFLNWVTRKTGWNKPSFIYGKGKTRDNKIIWIRAQMPHCHLVYSVNVDMYEGMYDRSFDLGNFVITDNMFKKGENCSFDYDKIRENKDLTLLVSKSYSNLIPDLTSKSFSGIQWLFVLHKVDPAGSFTFNTADPRIKNLNDGIYALELMDFPLQPIPYFPPPVTILNFDLECYTIGQFCPQTQPITHCAITLEHPKKPREFCLIDTKSIPDWSKKIKLNDNSVWCAVYTDFYKLFKKNPTIKYFFMTEKNILYIIKAFLESNDVDYVLTYNGHFMDIPYINKRLEIHGLPILQTLIPEGTESVPLYFQKSKTSNLLNTERCDITAQNGTIFFDLHNFVKKEEVGLASYSLESLSRKNFNGNALLLEKGEHWTFIFKKEHNKKLDFITRVLMSAGFINLDHACLKLFNKRITPEGSVFETEVIGGIDLEVGKKYYFEFGKDNIEIDKIYINYSYDIALEIAPYCQHDSNLCQFLWETYNVPYKIKAASCIYKMPQNKILFFYATTTSKGLVLTYYLDQKILYLERCSVPKIKFEGATVFEPDEKIISAPVLVLDYNSLYPNSCIFGNLSPETLVCHIKISDSIKMQLCMTYLQQRYPWPEYIVIQTGSVNASYIGEILVYDRRHKGIIPALLEKLISLRKQYKKNMKEFPDEYNLYDNLQLITKLAANSIYGLMGTNEFILKSINSAKSCTTIGRNMLGYLDDVFKYITFKPDGMHISKDITQIWKGTPLKRFYPSKDTLVDCSIKRVYGDTDSIFTKLIFDYDGDKIQMAATIGRFFESTINTEILFDQFCAEFEYILCNVIMFSKKKYYGDKYSPFYKPGDLPSISGKGYKKRDMCAYYLDVAKTIDSKIKDFVKDGMDGKALRYNVVEYLLTEFKDLITRQEEKVENCKFYFTRKYGADTEKGENPNSRLIKEWNKANPTNKVNIGERYYYTFVCPKELQWQTNVKNKRSYEYVLGGYSEAIPKNMRVFYEIILSRICDRVFKTFETDTKFIKTFSSKLFGAKAKKIQLTEPKFWNKEIALLLLED